MDTKLLLMTGSDYPVLECQIAIHQPTIFEIGLIGETNFFTAIQTVTIDKKLLDMDKSVLDNTNNFQIFMMIMNEKETIDKKQAVQDLFNLLFPNQKIIFSPQSIIINSSDQNIIIDESNFDFFQKAIREIFCLKNTLSNTFNPVNDEAKRIADKILKGREKIAKEKGEVETGSVYAQYISILSIALHLSIQELIKYTVFQLYDSMDRFGLWTDFDLDIRLRLAGGTPNKSSENWMKNIH